MKIKILAVGIIIILIALVLFSGLVPLSITGGGEYHTGINNNQVNNCETEHHKVATTWILGQQMGSWYGNIQNDYTELIRTPFDNGPVVTAMKSGEEKRSIDITIYGTATYIGLSSYTQYWWPDYGYYTVEYSSNGITWNKIIDTSTGSVDDNIIGDISGTYTQMIRYSEINPVPIPGYGSPVICRELDPVEFNIKDAQVGALRIKQIGKFTALAGTQTTYETLSTDYVFLISGEGDINIYNEQYVYEEGETITFQYTTSYSGSTQGGTYSSRGWEIKVYDALGNLRKTWDNIADDVFQGKINYVIPNGAYDPNGENEWAVVLSNTLFNQDEQYFFTVGVGMSDQGPSKPIITTENEIYELGETIHVTLHSDPNPAGRNTVYEFQIRIRNGKSGIDYITGWEERYLTATDGSVSFSFEPEYGDAYITIEAVAFDKNHAAGGIPSEKTKKSLWIKENIPNPVVEEINWIIILICIIIAIFGLIIGLFMPNIYLKILLPIIFIIIAVIIYLYFGMGVF